MAARKLINAPDAIVEEMLAGFVGAYPTHVRLAAPRLVVRAQPKAAGRVALVIGNGSGHEPIAMGFVGPGMLDANAVGDVFTAPPGSQIAAAVADRRCGWGRAAAGFQP